MYISYISIYYISYLKFKKIKIFNFYERYKENTFFQYVRKGEFTFGSTPNNP